MGLKITTHTDSMTVDLGGLSNDRKKARIKYSDIRSLVQSTDDVTVEIVFSSGEIYGFPFSVVDEVDGVAPTSQDDLYIKIETKLFT
jgi:hypothetical protein